MLAYSLIFARCEQSASLKQRWYIATADAVGEACVALDLPQLNVMAVLPQVDSTWSAEETQWFDSFPSSRSGTSRSGWDRWLYGRENEIGPKTMASDGGWRSSTEWGGREHKARSRTGSGKKPLWPSRGTRNVWGTLKKLATDGFAFGWRP